MFELKGVAKFCDEVDENLMITFSPYDAHIDLHECYINPSVAIFFSRLQRAL